MKQLPINGIIRSQSRLSGNDGACDEIINLRFKDGEWQLMRNKQEAYSLVSIPNISSYQNWYQHLGINDDWFIAENTYDDPYTIRLVKLDSTPTSTTILTMDENESVTKIIHFGYFLIINTNYNVYYLKWDSDDEQYIELPDLEHGLYSFSTFRDNSGSEDDRKEVGASNFDSGNMLTSLRNNISKIEKDGYTYGHTFFRVGFKLVDGTVIKPTSPYYTFIGMPKMDNSGSDAYNDFIRMPRVIHHYSYVAVWSYFGKPNFYNYFTAEQLSIIQLYTGLVESIVVYMSKPLPDRDYNITDGDKLLEIESLADYPDTGSRSLVFPYADNNITDHFEQLSLFYNVHEIPINDITTGVSEVIQLGNVNNLESKSTLEVDNYTAHKLISDSLMEFNSRLHLGAIKVKLGGMYNSSIKDNLSVTTDPVNDETITMLTNIEDISYKSNTSNQGQIYAIVKLNINNKTKTVVKRFADVSKYESITYHYYLIFNSIISYPDSRATSIQFVILDGSTYYALTDELNLVSQKYLNLAYYKDFTVKKWGNTTEPDIGARVLLYNAYEDTKGAVVTFTEDNYYTDTNRIQVSALNNFLYYPAENSYRVGQQTNEILGLEAQSIPMSEGQFGEYPLIVFTSSGIYALQQGSGDVLYQSIIPLNHEICNNPDSIISINQGILYTTEKGLNVLSGPNVIEISKPLEGEPDTFINSETNYSQSIDGTLDVVDLDTDISTVNFLEYLETAIISYDRVNNEIIVSNNKYEDGDFAYKYSYVYSIEYKTWYKTNQYFNHFVRTLPDNYGYYAGKLYNLSQEEEGTAYGQYFLIRTRPFTLDSLSLKTIKRITARYIGSTFEINPSEILEDNKKLAFYLYGSLDGNEWKLVNGKRIIAWSAFKRDIILRNTRTSARYFIIVLAAKAYEATIAPFELTDEDRNYRKIR